MAEFSSDRRRGFAIAVAALPLVILAMPSAARARAPTPYDKINASAASSPIVVHRLRGNISVLEGSGGNIGVLTGPDGIVMVDTGIAVSKGKIVAALRGLSPKPIRYAIDTHWHWDHSDGNAWVRQAGATLIASRKATERLTQTIRVVEWSHTFTPIARKARPNMILSGGKTLRLNGETLIIRPYRNGHTDGDLSVYFRRADILQTGDTWWNGVYPFIDYVTGGSIDGAIGAANANLALSTDRTVIIPGHGPVGSRKELRDFRDMLVAVRSRVAALKERGLPLDKAIAARPTAAYDARWGKGLINGALFTALVYRGV